jgi:Ni/Co efflux regulator RcnB
MKRLFCAVAAIALLVPAGSSAQQQNDRRHGNRTDQQQNRPNRQQPKNGTSGNRNRPNRERPTIQPVQPNRPSHGRPTIQPVPNRPSRPNHGRPTIQPVPNRPGRPNQGRPTIQPVPNRPVYQPGRRPPTYHRIRGPMFHYPRGYSYRRWGIGLILPHIFLSNYYYWTDWRALGLLPPPPGYVWVRYGPDLLLVNRFTGRIADVIYGAFY